MIRTHAISRRAALGGAMVLAFETFKTSKKHDGTDENPHWLTTAKV